MEAKKSKRTDLEWRKSVFFQVGLVVALLLVLLSFESFRQGEEKSTVRSTELALPEDVVLIVPTKTELVMPPAPKSFATNLRQIDNDGAETPDIFVFPEGEDDYGEIKLIEEEKEKEVTDREFWEFVEENPEYVGGDDARQKFLQDNLVYPKAAIEIGIEGTVIVEFIVESDGTLSSFTIARGNSPSLDAEALRVAKMMPKWKAGKQGNRAVRVKYRMPITFTLVQ